VLRWVFTPALDTISDALIQHLGSGKLEYLATTVLGISIGWQYRNALYGLLFDYMKYRLCEVSS